MGDNKNLDLTKGPILKQIVNFSMPLLMGNLLQQIYFIVDSMIVGKWIGSTALAAVGSTASITVLMVFFFMGMANGAGVLISQHFGAREEWKAKQVIKVAGLFTVFFGVSFSIAGYYMTDSILNWISMPEDCMAQSHAYLSVCFIGMLPMLIYNMGASALQAMGDSKTPLYYLLVASVINIVLDVVFVKGFHTDVEGTAYATIIAQAVSAALVMWTIYKKTKNFVNTDKKPHARSIIVLKKFLIVGFPIAMQNVVINFSNIVVQSHINGLGSDIMAAWSAFCRLDTFAILPFQSFGLAILTFVGQNYGAGNYNRILDGVKVGNKLSFVVTTTISIILCIVPAFFVSFFTDSQIVVEFAKSMMFHMVPLYFLLSLAKVFTSAISGMGDSITPMIVNVAFMCAYRIIAIPTLKGIVGNNMDTVYYTYWSSWVLTYVSIRICYTFKAKSKLRTTKDGELLL